MKRVALSLFGIALMVCSTGCCLLGCGSPCGSPCGPCGASSYYGGGGGCSSGTCGPAYPQGAFYDGNSVYQASAYNSQNLGMTQTAMAPVEALPTY